MKHSAPPAVTRLALKELREDKDAKPGDTIAYCLPHDFVMEVELDGTEHHAEMSLEQTWYYKVLSSSELKFDEMTVNMLDFKMRKGPLPPEDMPKMTCGHPMGCGSPCKWCILKTEVIRLLLACTGGDIVGTTKAILATRRALEE